MVSTNCSDHPAHPNISKLDGTDFVAWQRTLRTMTNLVRPEISEILEGQLHPHRFTGQRVVAVDPQPRLWLPVARR